MKTLICFSLLLFLACTESTKSKPLTIDDFVWNQLLSAPDSITSFTKNDDISFIDDNLGWAIGSGKAEVHKTTDGGDTWEFQFKAPKIEGVTNPYFRSIGFLTKDVGYVGLLNGVEYGHIVYETRDGGSTWNPVTVIDNSPLQGVCAMYPVNEKTIFIVGRIGGSAHVAKTTDQGLTWTFYDVNSQIEMLTDVYFWDENNGVILGGKRDDSYSDNIDFYTYSNTVIIGTTDGGETWTERYQSDRLNEWAWKFSFPSEKIGYASIQSFRGAFQGSTYSTEYFLKTTDKGKTWTEMVFSNTEDDYYNQQGIGFISEKIGWMGSWIDDNGMMFTDDGGVTWNKTDHVGTVNRFRFLNKSAYAIGHNIFKMDLPK